MKRWKCYWDIILIALYALVIGAWTISAEANPGYKASYLKNWDGDTVTFLVVAWPVKGDVILLQRNIRLAGVDTPEINGKCEKEKQLAQNAKIYTQVILEASDDILIVPTGDSTLGRPVAHILVNGENLAEQLVKNGLAVFSKKQADWCDGTKPES